MLLPDGWGGRFAVPTKAWVKPSSTWSYGVLGEPGVCALIAALVWVAYFALDDQWGGDGTRPGPGQRNEAPGAGKKTPKGD